MAVQLEGVDELLARLPAPLDHERRHRTGTPAVAVLAGGVEPGRRREPGVEHLLHVLVLLEELGHRRGVGHMALHPQRQRLQALEQEEGVEGADRGTEVTQELDSGLGDVGPGAQHGPVGEAVVAGVGLVEAGVAVGVGEVERAAVDDGAHDRVAVTAQELGGRVDHDVGPPVERADQVRGGHRVVEDEGHTHLVGHVGHALDVEDVVHRVADGLAVEGLGVGAHGPAPGVEIVDVVHERGLDPELGQGVVQQVVGAAVQGGPGHDVAAGLGQVHDGHRLGRLARRHHQGPRHPGGGGAQAVLQGGQPNLGHPLGGVHDPGVDHARLGQGEQVGGVVRVAELVGRGLVDGHGPGPGGDVGLLPGVDLSCLETPTLSSHLGSRPFLISALVSRRWALTLTGFPSRSIGFGPQGSGM